MIRKIEHNAINTYRIGIMNLNQVFKLTFVRANDGKINPVGETNDNKLIPYMYEFTTSRPGIFTITMSAPMIGIVNTAIPELELMKKEKTA